MAHPGGDGGLPDRGDLEVLCSAGRLLPWCPRTTDSGLAARLSPVPGLWQDHQRGRGGAGVAGSDGIWVTCRRLQSTPGGVHPRQLGLGAPGWWVIVEGQRAEPAGCSLSIESPPARHPTGEPTTQGSRWMARELDGGERGGRRGHTGLASASLAGSCSVLGCEGFWVPGRGGSKQHAHPHLGHPAVGTPRPAGQGSAALRARWDAGWHGWPIWGQRGS